MLHSDSATDPYADPGEAAGEQGADGDERDWWHDVWQVHCGGARAAENEACRGGGVGTRMAQLYGGSAPTAGTGISGLRR